MALCQVMSRFTLKLVRLTFDARSAFNIINDNINCHDLSDLFMTRNIPYDDLGHTTETGTALT